MLSYRHVRKSLVATCFVSALVISALFASSGCLSAAEHTMTGTAVSLDSVLTFSSAENERDAIFSMAAYVVVYKDWQTSESGSYRGHNIGCILVDPSGTPVAWNRNCSGATKNSTQHGEVRAMQNYIEKSGNKYLKGYTVYTTLEPCAMCSGMMCLTKVSRCVYGQTDDNYPDGSAGFGRAIERLNLNSSELSNGFLPYPRTPARSDASELKFRYALDIDFSTGRESNITAFLISENARVIYKAAADSFFSYAVQYPENKGVYEKTLNFINSIGK